MVFLIGIFLILSKSFHGAALTSPNCYNTSNAPANITARCIEAGAVCYRGLLGNQLPESGDSVPAFYLNECKQRCQCPNVTPPDELDIGSGYDVNCMGSSPSICPFDYAGDCSDPVLKNITYYCGSTDSAGGACSANGTLYQVEFNAGVNQSVFEEYCLAQCECSLVALGSSSSNSSEISVADENSDVGDQVASFRATEYKGSTISSSPTSRSNETRITSTPTVRYDNFSKDCQIQLERWHAHTNLPRPACLASQIQSHATTT